MSDSQSASQEGNMNSPHLVARYRIQPTTVAINHNALLLPQLKGRLNTGILHITYMHSIHTNFFHSEYVCMECRPIYILQHLRARPYFKGDTTQPKIQFIMALMIFSARSQVDPLPCLECSPACELPHSCRESKDDQILIISNPYCKCSFNWFILYTHVWGKTGNIKASPFISLCILRDLPQQKILRELCGGGGPTIILCSHVHMERFFDGMNQKNSKQQEGKNGGKKKKRFLHTWRFPYSCVLHWSGTPSGYHPHATLPQENQLKLEPPLQLTNE